MAGVFSELSSVVKEMKEEIDSMKKSVYKGNSLAGQEDIQIIKNSSEVPDKKNVFKGVLFS